MRLRKDARIAALGRVPMFERCSKRELGKIAAVVGEVDIPQGTPLVREGESGGDFFIVLSGEADVRRSSRKLATLRPGDFFGELALVMKAPRTATVTAGTSMRLLTLGQREFQRLLMGSPRIQLKILETVAERVDVLRSERAPQRIIHRRRS